MERGAPPQRTGSTRSGLPAALPVTFAHGRINATGQLWARGPSQMDAGRGGFDAFRSMRRACR